MNRFDQTKTAAKTDMEKDLHVVEVKTLGDAKKIFEDAVKSQNAAIRPIHIKAKKSGDLGSDANGQLFLQLEHEEEIFGCMLCSSADNAKNIYLIESSEEIPQAVLREQYQNMLTAEQMMVSVFDVKMIMEIWYRRRMIKPYPRMISQKYF